MDTTFNLALRVLHSYRVGEDSTYTLFEVILTDAFHNAMRRNLGTQSRDTKLVLKHREMRGLLSVALKSHSFRAIALEEPRVLLLTVCSQEKARAL